MAPEQRQRLEEMTIWLIRHPGIAESLCAECFTPQGDDLLDIMRQLRRQGYYELLMLFIMRSQFTIEGQQALARFCAAHLIKEAKQADLDTMLEELEMILSDEILQRKERMRQRAESE